MEEEGRRREDRTAEKTKRRESRRNKHHACVGGWTICFMPSLPALEALEAPGGPWRPLTSEPMPRRTDFQLEALEACEWLPVVCWLETRDQIQNDSGYQDRINYRGQDRTATRDEVSTLRSLSTIYLSLYRHQVKSSQVDQSNIIPSSACFFLSFSF